MQKYDVVVNGMKTCLILSPEEAKRRGLTKPATPQSDGKKSRQPANKAVIRPRNK